MHRSRKRRRMVRERACLVCGTKPCDAHHYPVRVSQGGRDTLDNMVPLCRIHHSAWHDGEEWVVEMVAASAPLYFETLT